MGLASLQADIIDRRSQNGARIIFEDQYPQGDALLSPQGDPALAAMAAAVGMTPGELIAIREWAQRMTKECNERLSREMTLVYTLDEETLHEQWTKVVAVEYVLKREAVEMTKVAGGQLLDLDRMYGGLLACNRYVFVSEKVFRERRCKYDNAVTLLEELMEERWAA
jgi:hypothetical protein